MPSFEEIASWLDRYEVPDEVARCCMVGLLTSLTRLPDGTPGPWCAELTQLDERDVEGEDVSAETAALCRSIVGTFPWLQPHILKHAARIKSDWELLGDTLFDDDVFNIELVLHEIASSLLGLQSVRSIELVHSPQLDGPDYLLHLTPWQGQVIRIGLSTLFEEDDQEELGEGEQEELEEEEIDNASESSEKLVRSFDKQLWFGREYPPTPTPETTPPTPPPSKSPSAPH